VGGDAQGIPNSFMIDDALKMMHEAAAGMHSPNNCTAWGGLSAPRGIDPAGDKIFGSLRILHSRLPLSG
jgi:hypothetical protein